MKETQYGRRLFVKQVAIGLSGSFLLPGFAFSVETDSLPRSSPEAQGMSSSDILKFVEMAEATNAGLHSFMVIRHGYVVAEGWWAPYSAEEKHWLYSLSKNFTATAIGLALDEGLLHLEDKVISFFPPTDLPEVVDEKLSAMTVRDLLTMSSGHATDTLRPLMSSADGNWSKTFFSIPLQYKPGSRFVYNSGATYMLSAILQMKVGRPMVEFLQPRLFKPLGIKNAAWDCDPKGINFGAAGLRLSTEDIAKFSQLYLQKGIWKGKRLLSERWVNEATSFKIANDDTGTPTKKEEDDIKQGYGYSFWLSRPVAQGAYRSEGAFCQFSIVMPKQDAVVAITAEGVSTKRVMDLTWNILLPAMKEKRLPKSPAALHTLKRKLEKLSIKPPQSKSNSPHAAAFSGKKFMMEKNARMIESATFNFGNERTHFILTDGKETYHIECGIDEWKLGKTNIPGSPTNLLYGVPLPQKEWKIAASGAWIDEKTFVMTWLFYESPHYDTITCKFNNDEVQIEFANSISRILRQYKDPRPPILGRIMR